MKQTTPSWKDTSIPKGTKVSKMKAAGVSITKTFQSIWRHKRRSVGMVSGLILGISILAGIFIYSNVMMNNIYDTVIEGSPFEIRMDFRGEANDSEVESYRSMFLNDPENRVADAQVFYGNGYTETTTQGMSMRTHTIGGTLDADLEFGVTETDYPSGARIIGNLTEFLSGDIGSRFKELVVGEKDLSSVDRGIWIDAKFADSARVQVGMEIDRLNITITKSSEENRFDRITVSKISLYNLTVAGIVNLELEASAGLFSDVIFSDTEIFVPSDLVNDTLFFNDLVENEMRYCVLKIDETKFDLADLAIVNTQIDTLINSFELIDPLVLVGSNLVSEKLLPFQIMNFFIILFDFVLTVPVVILSVYLLSFGIDLSLEERRYQVGVLKTQGASGKQIKRKIIGETMLLAAFGIIIGYICALIGAWGIGTARGYMSFDWVYAVSQIGEFIILDINTIIIVGGIVCIALLLMANGKSNKFIEMEISETVKTADEDKKENFLKRNNLDIGFFAVGIITLIIVFMQQAGISVNLGLLNLVFASLGPFTFWIGGAAVVSRIAVWLPTKIDPLLRKLSMLKDVNVLIKSNIFRKSGDVPRLALIIALTVSFAVLAAVQGTTGEVHQERMITWSTGSDIQVKTDIGISSDSIAMIKNSSNSVLKDVQEIMAVSLTQGRLLNDDITVYSVDAAVMEDACIWQTDNFPQNNREELLGELASNSTYGCLIGEDLLEETSLTIGNEIEMEFMVFHLTNISNPTVDFDYVEHSIKILGTFNHLPGGIGSNGLVVDHQMISSMYNFSSFADQMDSIGVLSFSGMMLNFSSLDVANFGIIADSYLVKTAQGADTAVIKNLLENDQLYPTISSVITLEDEIRQANELQNADYGIPGLLTMDFIVSLIASTLATFIFMSILMEQRKKEFAIMRSYGASKGQVYKVVFSESIIFLLTSVIWGLIIGIGLSILFNGFFEFIDIFITPFSVLASGSGLDRTLIFDPQSLFLTVGLSFASMLLATYLSVRSTLKTSISTVVRQL